MSSSEASSSSRSSSPEPQKGKNLKRKRSQNVSKPLESSDDSESDSTDSEQEAGVEVDEEEDVPVLSHKELRKQKKLEKKKAVKAAAAGDEDSEVPKKKRKLKDGAAASDDSPASQKRQNSVWVGNMSFKTTPENLRTFFKDVGEITRIHMPMKPALRPNLPKENRGFAYVDFATPEAKVAAIALSENPLVGRKLLIKDGGDFSGRPVAPGVDVKTNDSELAQKTHSKTAQKILRSQKQPPAPTLFLGNLPFETTDDDIRQLFEAHRQAPKAAKKKVERAEDVDAPVKGAEKSKDEFILKVRMGTFEDSGMCKGFAFVDFASIDHATSTLINPKNHHFNGRDLKVEFAGADAVRRGAAKHLLPGGDAKDGKKPFGGKSRGPKDSKPPRPSREASDGTKGSTTEFKSRSNYGEAPAAGEEAGGEEEQSAPKREKRQRPAGSERLGRDGKKRPKPGAALALAKRETAAIVPGQGKKITF
ncbi:hypothetical protein BKA70DRAFT_1256707 [Coprinopsis sp. MPI-PUGE-AT-0042]|nr:hypothetical protein BKA70DRAFT_1256707 [Coprinopsis sp. MPI-PUGE-AT-0042]